MAEAEAATQEVDDLDKASKDEGHLAKRWIAEIAAAEKAQAKWIERAKKIEKIYADERDTRADRGRKFNILWSNVETLRPAVYMQTPKPRAVRRYRDKDPVARFGALLIERGVTTSCELYDFDNTMDQAVRDRLVVGRGQAWVFYMPGIEGEGDEASLAYEDVQADYVCWQDFLHSVSRTWSEVWWVGRWFHKSRSELKTWLSERDLDPSKAATVAMDLAPDGDKTDDGMKDERARARILEVWNKRDKHVLYVAVSSADRAILGQVKPPVAFRDFYPCPRPMLATTTAKSLIPTPDYALYQDQAEELNRVTDRIGVLQRALKVVGVYASDSSELAQMLEAGDNRMVPVKNWAMFAEGGGARNKIEWFPVDVVAKVLEGLYIIRDQAKQTLYEVSGIGDILRGATDPDETATAQGIKAKWGSLRVRRIQKDVQRFAADIMRLKAEVLTEQFRPQSILAMGGVDEELLSKYVPDPPPPQLPPQLQQMAQDPEAKGQVQQIMQQLQQKARAEAAKQFVAATLAMLKDDTARNFRIDVETDSTLEPDQAEEKQTAVELTTAVGAFLKEAGPMMAAGGPEVADMLGEMLLFVVRRFGNNVDQLEKKIEAMVEAAKKPKPPAPNPEMMKAEATVKKTDADIELAKAEMQLKAQDAQLRSQDGQSQQGLEQEKLKLEAALGRSEALIKAKGLQLKGREIELKERELVDGKEDREKDRQLSEYTLRRKAAPDDEAEEIDAQRDGAPSRTEQLIAAMTSANEALIGTVVAELRRPKRVVRGADGRAEGVE